MKDAQETLLFVLGSADREMAVIHSAAARQGHHVGLACDADFKRCSPRSAYDAREVDMVNFATGTDYSRVVRVECDGPAIAALTDDPVVVDHHRPGDPGFDGRPEEFWESSSIGQVFDLIGLVPSARDLLVAASDHCPGHAYKGRCPGVDPKLLANDRVHGRARHCGIDPATLERRIVTAEALIEQQLRDGADLPFFASQVDELPEACLRRGVAVSYRMPSRDGDKIGVLNGEPPMIRRWMEQTAPALGLLDIYGSPERGYAGGYLADQA